MRSDNFATKSVENLIPPGKASIQAMNRAKEGTGWAMGGSWPIAIATFSEKQARLS